MLSGRIQTDLDPSRQVSQLQIPIEIGCSENLKERLANYAFNTRMTSTPDTWRLTVSIIEYIGIKMVHIRIPLVKVWEQDQLHPLKISSHSSASLRELAEA